MGLDIAQLLAYFGIPISFDHGYKTHYIRTIPALGQSNHGREGNIGLSFRPIPEGLDIYPLLLVILEAFVEPSFRYRHLCRRG